MIEILDLYNNLDLPKINIQYKDYCRMNKTYNQSNAIKKTRAILAEFIQSSAI